MRACVHACACVTQPFERREALPRPQIQPSAAQRKPKAARSDVWERKPLDDGAGIRRSMLVKRVSVVSCGIDSRHFADVLEATPFVYDLRMLEPPPQRSGCGAGTPGAGPPAGPGPEASAGAAISGDSEHPPLAVADTGGEGTVASSGVQRQGVARGVSHHVASFLADAHELQG